MRNYGYIPSALPDSRCYSDSGLNSPSDITKALSEIFTTSEGPQLADAPASSADNSPARSSQSDSYAPSPSHVADTAEALDAQAPKGDDALNLAGPGAVAEQAPKVVLQPTPVPQQGA